MDPQQLSAAFLVGLLGGVHCVGMCGGIVGALTLTLPEERRRGIATLWPFLAGYNAGRLTSYVAAGAVMGGLGQAAVDLAGLHRAQQVLSVAAGLFMVALGLYLAGWWRGLARVEQAGGRLWRLLEPFGRRFLPVRRPTDAWMVGLVWGWLPCGLVYSVLVWALAAGSVQAGAALMLAFGLGTLPTLFALGTMASRLGGLLRRPVTRWVAGGLVVAFGVVQVARGF